MSKGNSGRTVNNNNNKNEKDNSKHVVKMTIERARAIQKHADKFNTNQDFKSRAMRAADKNEKEKE